MNLLTSIITSDALVGCVFLVVIALVSLRLLPVHFISEWGDAAPSVSIAATAYDLYEKVSKSSARKARATYHCGLRKTRSTKWIADESGYAEKLERFERAIEVNAVVSSAIFRLATTNDKTSPGGNDKRMDRVTRDVNVGAEDHAKVREALKHFVRDWSEEGRRERSNAFGLVLDALQRLESEVSRRGEKRVLVPGAGLGRLAWEISQLGSFPRFLYA
jgi:carnosine N-methyltransferase